jgi:hypothetical protein
MMCFAGYALYEVWKLLPSMPEGSYMLAVISFTSALTVALLTFMINQAHRAQAKLAMAGMFIADIVAICRIHKEVILVPFFIKVYKSSLTRGWIPQ